MTTEHLPLAHGPTVSPLPQNPLRAAGTLPRPLAVTRPGLFRRTRLIAEILLLFVAAPFAIRVALFDWKVPLFYLLPPLLAAFLSYLLWDDTFRVVRELAQGISISELLSILGIFVLAGSLLTVAVAMEKPEIFLSLPQERPLLWKKVMALYPFLSVLPQEFLYRTFFFHRYGPLFGERRWLLIVVNGLLFGLVHLIFKNWIAVAGTIAGGVLFAWRYERTRSFWGVSLEHTLWGWWVFTVGLGGYFFTGIANPV